MLRVSRAYGSQGTLLSVSSYDFVRKMVYAVCSASAIKFVWNGASSFTLLYNAKGGKKKARLVSSHSMVWPSNRAFRPHIPAILYLQ